MQTVLTTSATIPLVDYTFAYTIYIYIYSYRCELYFDRSYASVEIWRPFIY